ncbi:WecB/TagA/CpsF family glycosyltransferase [Microbacterium luticocti]|uniref:WecB/TagA/CpsF family glycosyltransferase n=1 Tax=Microbacterium luticocti TaxID=451764 RepID=UPI0004276B5C|nr:WecB/TagA/CpsF family glycosyltransferase [Microbacterium luticocti]
MSRTTITRNPLYHRRHPLPAPPAPRSDPAALDELPRILIGGTPVHLVDERGARRVIARAMHDVDGPPLGVCSVNLDHVHHFAHTADRFDGAGPVRWLDLIDGAPVAAQARRMTGTAYPRLAGSDIITGILDDLAVAGLSLGVVGGGAEVTGPLRERLAAGWPGLRFAGHWTPPRAQLESAAGCHDLAADVRAARANAVLVCLGKPRQERWIAEYGALTGARGLFAFGAVVDFLAGRMSHAPRWVAAAHAEWLWRLALEPRRLARRYLVEGPPAYLAVRASGASPSERGPST